MIERTVTSEKFPPRPTNQKTAVILEKVWRIIDSPDPLEGGGFHQNDHAERVIWLAPGLNPARRAAVLEVALERAARQALSFLASVE